MAFRRRTPTQATARSVATRIDEVGGADRGFLWRLNSCWRYEQVDGGVRIDLESLTLSRDVPTLVRPIASPIVSRIARESMVRTLDALCRYLDPAAEPKPCPAGSAGQDFAVFIAAFSGGLSPHARAVRRQPVREEQAPALAHAFLTGDWLAPMWTSASSSSSDASCRCLRGPGCGSATRSPGRRSSRTGTD